MQAPKISKAQPNLAPQSPPKAVSLTPSKTPFVSLSDTRIENQYKLLYSLIQSEETPWPDQNELQ